MSKGLYAGVIGISFGVALILQFYGFFAYGIHGPLSYSDSMSLVGVNMIAKLVAIPAGVFIFLWIYKIWKSIQDGNARTTPGRAVGFLFIPVYNIVWAFQVIWGFAKDYNGYIQRRGLNAQRLPEALFLAVPIAIIGDFALSYASVYLAPFTSVARVAITLLVVMKACDAVNALPSSQADASSVTQK